MLSSEIRTHYGMRVGLISAPLSHGWGILNAFQRRPGRGHEGLSIAIFDVDSNDI